MVSSGRRTTVEVVVKQLESLNLTGVDARNCGVKP
jgi:hypothetical protein